MLARLETEMMLTALLKRFATIALAGEPERKLNNTLRQLKRLSVAIDRGMREPTRLTVGCFFNC